jgi:hypothetical protein
VSSDCRDAFAMPSPVAAASSSLLWIVCATFELLIARPFPTALRCRALPRSGWKHPQQQPLESPCSGTSKEADSMSGRALRPLRPKCTGPGRARGRLTLRLAVPPKDVELRGRNNQRREDVLFYVWVQPTEGNLRLGSEREHTAQNGEWKLLDAR